MQIEQITPELTWRLRRDALYPAKKIFEMELESDTYGMHFGAFKEVKLVGVVSLFKNGTAYQFCKLAIDPQEQNAGVGRTLVQYITDYAKETDGTRIWCNARLTVAGFYLKLGFIQTDQLFSKNGYDYVIMEKAI